MEERFYDFLTILSGIRVVVLVVVVVVGSSGGGWLCNMLFCMKSKWPFEDLIGEVLEERVLRLGVSMRAD